MRKLLAALAALVTLSLTGCGYNTLQSNDEQIKNLSVNNVYLQIHFAQRDDASCKMVECEEAALKLLIAHQ